MSTQQTSAEAADVDLVARLAAGDPRALRDLHRRYAALVFAVAARLVEPAAAEEVVQDVFTTLWQKHEAFDPTHGAFKGWLCQTARRHALEMMRSRGEALDQDGGGLEGAEGLDALDDVADEALEPDERLWSLHRRTALRDAVDALPHAQRRALSLAYFDELTLDQVAAVLRVPLGIKTRIRLAMRRLGPMLALLAAGATILTLWRRRDLEIERDERALAMVTSSDVVAMRLSPAPGVLADTHANFRVCPGGRLGILKASHLADLQGDERYVGWARCAGVWRRLGELDVDPDGAALLVVEDTALSVGIDELELTRESGAGAEPKGPLVVGWTATQE